MMLPLAHLTVQFPLWESVTKLYPSEGTLLEMVWLPLLQSVYVQGQIQTLSSLYGMIPKGEGSQPVIS